MTEGNRVGVPAQRWEAIEIVVRPAMAICGALPNAPTLSPALLKAWTSLFVEADLRPEDVEKAFRRHLMESRWFPAPADIIELARSIGRVLVSSLEESNEVNIAFEARRAHLEDRRRVIEAGKAQQSAKAIGAGPSCCRAENLAPGRGESLVGLEARDHVSMLIAEANTRGAPRRLPEAKLYFFSSTLSQ